MDMTLFLVVGPLVDVLGTAGLAATNCGLWTLRVALAAQDRRHAAATVSALDAVVFALVFGQVATGLESPARLAGYAVGIGLGTLAGLAIDERLTARRAVAARAEDAPSSDGSFSR